MKTIVPKTTLNIIIESNVYATEKDVDEGDVCKHKARPEIIRVFQDVYGEYGYDRTIRIDIKPEDIDKIYNHLEKVRNAEFDQEYTDDLPF